MLGQRKRSAKPTKTGKKQPIYYSHKKAPILGLFYGKSGQTDQSRSVSKIPSPIRSMLLS